MITPAIGRGFFIILTREKEMTLQSKIDHPDMARFSDVAAKLSKAPDLKDHLKTTRGSGSLKDRISLFRELADHFSADLEKVFIDAGGEIARTALTMKVKRGGEEVDRSVEYLVAIFHDMESDKVYRGYYRIGDGEESPRSHLAILSCYHSIRSGICRS